VHGAEPFPGELLRMRGKVERRVRPALDHLRRDAAVWAFPIPGLVDLGRQREHDRDGRPRQAPREIEQRSAIASFEVRRVDHGQSRPPQTMSGRAMEQVERRRRRPLVVLVIGDHRAERVRREHLGRAEVAPRERRFSCARRSDQQDERVTGNDEDVRPVRQAGRSLSRGPM
jgi:hypothetical protein